MQSFASVYTQRMRNTITKSYLAELKGLAKISGGVHAEVLKHMISRISESTTDDALATVIIVWMFIWINSDLCCRALKWLVRPEKCRINGSIYPINLLQGSAQ